jgi:hypothetical protein
MNISKYRKARFLKREDLPIKLTITGADEMKVSRSAKEPDYKIVLDFENDLGEKFRLSLNQTNLEAIANRFGDETENWVNQEIGFWWNPKVEMDGEVVGGIRVVPAEEEKEIPF